MFTTRVLFACALLGAVAALPTDKPTSDFPKQTAIITDDDFDNGEGGWFSFPLFGNLFAPLWRLFPSFADFGPKITTDDDKFQVIVNVKDYKKPDLKVKVKGDFIFVQGSHEAKQDAHDIFASQFFHTYTLPANSSGSDVTADLSSDGFLIVTVPLKGTENRAKESDREVPINETGVPYQKEVTPADATTQAVSEDDRKEPTTPSEREEVTEKDNVIPHGNEISP
ncbi:alpha-crystallin A chain [Amyelois transitella]|uniref:alpha-crystallin A chain n=1 Tax=Amyelois transitella TaxID=680683 RepID=UPI00067B8128|nr:alpha-crystallin A chain [Amyelois transitella]